MIEVVFLTALAVVWISAAVFQDIKTHEIANWISFSLIVFALGFRFFYSLFSGNGFSFFYQGLIGLGIFFILGNLFYYGRLFAGGDAKLMIALGTILPLTESLSNNIKIFIAFIVIFFASGAIYTMVTSIAIGLKDIQKLSNEFKKQIRRNKNKISLSMFLAILLVISGLLTDSLLIWLAILVFIIPYIYIYAKSVDESSMIKSVSPRRLEEGDWLYKDVKIKGKTIKADWGGLTKEDIKLLKKSNRKILIREGIPFTPVFLISFVLLILMYSWILVWSIF